MMTPLQRYLFDTTGYLHIKDVLASDELGNAQHAVRRFIDASTDKIPFGPGDFLPFLVFDKSLENLVLHPTIWPIITELTGGKPRMLTGSHLKITTHNDAPLRLHSLREPVMGKLGPRPEPYWQGGHTYCHEGKILCDYFNVFWYFTDVFPGDGGLVLVPGSHKSQLARPPEVSRGLFNSGEFFSDGSLPQGLVNVTPRAGDVVIVNEELTHGTMKWNPTDRNRIVFLLGCGPQHVVGSEPREDLPQEDLDRLSPETREFLEMAPVDHTKEIVNRENLMDPGDA
ncbi:MAG: phytanoyl-CoA dioxygenase family protein [Candidatus Poribacteria bacterium]|nr:phytanoyl-CoA dioxygenase family protein [Candidatus Poribacteria bacterium]MDE0506414.1 phytanoyl-CoA dioxygenase family protein [Candidatus Poribacteria bacterium]